MKVKCRAKLSPRCIDGEECVRIYGEDSMRDDGLFNGESVICDACYVLIGAPGMPFPASRRDVLAHVDGVVADYRRKQKVSG